MSAEKVENKRQNDAKLAALAQALYLSNITVLPLVAFVILLIIYNKNRNRFAPITLLHFRQAILANLVSGFLLVVISALILLTGSLNSPYTWMYLLIYFLSIHSALILYGVFALIKASEGEVYVYPVFGKYWR